MFGIKIMVYRVEIYRDDKGIVVLQFLKISHPSVIPGRIYDFSKVKKWMCELYTFSQIRSYMYNNYTPGADPGEGHRGQMTPPSEPCQGSQKIMYLYENNEFKLSFL